MTSKSEETLRRTDLSQNNKGFKSDKINGKRDGDTMQDEPHSNIGKISITKT